MPHKDQPAVSATRARKEFASLLGRAEFGGERILIERQGKPVAALISADELAAFERLEDERDAHIGELALAAQGDEPLESLEDATREIFDGAYDSE